MSCGTTSPLAEADAAFLRVGSVVGSVCPLVREYHQVFRAVVVLVTIDVMYYLSGAKGPSEHFLGYDPVLMLTMELRVCISATLSFGGPLPCSDGISLSFAPPDGRVLGILCPVVIGHPGADKAPGAFAAAVIMCTNFGGIPGELLPASITLNYSFHRSPQAPSAPALPSQPAAAWRPSSRRPARSCPGGRPSSGSPPARRSSAP